MNRRDLLRALAGVGTLGALSACTTHPRAATPSSEPPLDTTTTTSTTTTTTATSPAGSAATGAATTGAPAAVTADPSARSAWSPGQPASYVDHGDPTTGLVALTFHFAGEPALVTRLLDLLKANDVRSTLFAIGDWITAHPALGHRALTDGHELGNHTKSHPALLQLDRDQVHAEIAGGGAALIPFIGSIGTWFRPSGTDVPTQLILDEAGKVGYPISVGYDIDSRDYTDPGAPAVIANVAPELHPGAIVSLHFGHADTLGALPSILDELTKRNLRHATVTQLLAPGATG